MDFNAKRLSLLAGIGNPEDRHDIVQEQAQQLNESIEARKVDESESDVRIAVRRTIQKMIAEGSLSPKQQKSLDRFEDALLKGADAEEDSETGEIKIKFAADEKEKANESDDPEELIDADQELEADEEAIKEVDESDDEAVISEMEDGSLTLEMGGKTYSLKEILAEVEDDVEEI